MDLRLRFSQISDNDLFTLLTRETDDTLYEKMVTGCLVERIFEKNVKVKLTANELDGYIYIANLSADRIDSCFDHAKPGQFINCAIKSIDKAKFSVELTAKPMDLEDALDETARREKRRADSSYFVQWEEDDERDVAMDAKKKAVKERKVIRHRYYKNMDYKAAEAYLADQEDGAVVIRPSTKGMDHISLTWKIHSTLYQHIGILLSLI